MWNKFGFAWLLLAFVILLSVCVLIFSNQLNLISQENNVVPNSDSTEPQYDTAGTDVGSVEQIVGSITNEQDSPMVPKGGQAENEMQVYSNDAHKFTLVYPQYFVPTEDRSGWPRAEVLFLHEGYAQSYDLVVEIWDSEAELQHDRSPGTRFTALGELLPDITLKQLRDGKVLSMWNINGREDVSEIVASFSEVE